MELIFYPTHFLYLFFPPSLSLSVLMICHATLYTVGQDVCISEGDREGEKRENSLNPTQVNQESWFKSEEREREKNHLSKWTKEEAKRNISEAKERNVSGGKKIYSLPTIILLINFMSHKKRRSFTHLFSHSIRRSTQAQLEERQCKWILSSHPLSLSLILDLSLSHIHSLINLRTEGGEKDTGQGFVYLIQG